MFLACTLGRKIHTRSCQINVEDRVSAETTTTSEEIMNTLLVVDDEPDILDAIRRLFRKRYNVLTAQSVHDARLLLEEHDVQVILADQRMPRSTGIEFFCELHKTHPEIIRVLFTGYTNIDDVIDAINEGHVYRYISKPWKPSELKLFISQAFEHYNQQKEREHLTQQLKEANDQLEAQNSKLSNANEELMALDEVRRVFMEVISHELNTPIAIILGYVFLLQRELGEDMSAMSTKAVDRIVASSQRLKQISERIFQMISMESPDHALNIEPVHLREFAMDLHNQVEPFLSRRNQQLMCQIEMVHDELEADYDKLLDIFTHLVINAIKFSKDGEKIYFRARPNPDNSNEILLSVRDHGVGISPEDQAQIFNIFFSTFRTAHHSSGDYEFNKRGMGLGLSIAKKFTQMHHGRIEVQSEPDRGSTFWVYLPIKQPLEAPAQVN